MADNYLERRMDDYRAGKLSSPRRKHLTVSSAAPGADAATALEGSRVLIRCHSTSSSPRASALATMLASAGCRVAFTDTDSHGGTLLARSTGTQCHPIDMADEVALARSVALIERRWGGIVFTVDI